MTNANPAPGGELIGGLSLQPGTSSKPSALFSRRAFVSAALAVLISSSRPSTLWAAREESSAGSIRIAIDDLSDAHDPRLLRPKSLAPTRYLAVPYRSQLDGSPQASANCGPACLSMLLSYFGDLSSIADLRYSVNTFMKIWRVDNGSSWEALAAAAASRGFEANGLSGRKGVYRRWNTDELLAETAAGRPVIILTRYRSLPGREASWFRYNHYVVVVGQDNSGAIVYHDPAYLDEASGALRRMTREQLDSAWSKVSSGIAYSGMMLRPLAT